MRYKLSQYVHFMELSEDRVLVSHSFNLTRLVVDKRNLERLKLFKIQLLSFDDFLSRFESEDDLFNPVEMFETFRSSGFIVSSGANEADVIRTKVNAQILENNFKKNTVWNAPVPEFQEGLRLSRRHRSP